MTLLALASACAYRGADDALSQRMTWFSYMNGDDIRAACIPGALDRWRFVYNGVYVRQARTYDISPTDSSPTAVGGRYLVRERVLGPSDLSDVTITDPIETLTQDPLDLLAPFAGRKASVELAGRDLDELDRVLTASGFFRPAPTGLYLRSEDFFWVGVACTGGRVVFNAWRWPSEGFDALTFPRLLFSWDETGVPVQAPRELSTFQIYGEPNPDGKAPQFTLTVGKNGLAGVGTLF